MGLSEELSAIAGRATAFARDGEKVAGVIAAEPATGQRVYLVAFETDHERSWLALDPAGESIASRNRVREAVSIAALCELASETAGGGELEELRSRLVTLRLTESPDGIDEAEDAALALEEVVGAPPKVASPAYLDEIGAATRRLEEALGSGSGSPFAQAMRQGAAAVEALTAEVEGNYKGELR